MKIPVLKKEGLFMFMSPKMPGLDYPDLDLKSCHHRDAFTDLC